MGRHKAPIERWELGKFFDCRVIEDNSVKKIRLPTRVIEWLLDHGYIDHCK